MSSTTPVERKRGGCLTAFLILALVVNPLLGLYYLVQGATISQMLPNVPTWIIPVLGVLSLVNFGFIIAIWRWKKWGVYGFVGLTAIVLVINLLTIGITAIPAGVLSLAVLGFLLRPVWDDMD